MSKWGWHYIAVQNEDGEWFLHENFPGYGHTENPVTVGAESVEDLAELLRAAARDIEAAYITEAVRSFAEGRG